MKKGSVIARFLLGTLLSCGILAALLYFSLPFGENYLAGVFEEGAAGKLMERTQDIWGGVLIGMNLVALAGLVICPKKGVPLFPAIFPPFAASCCCAHCWSFWVPSRSWQG